MMLWIRSVVDTAKKAAQHRVADDHNGADDHGPVVVHAEQAVDQGADGLEAGGGCRG